MLRSVESIVFEGLECPICGADFNSEGLLEQLSMDINNGVCVECEEDGCDGHLSLDIMINITK